MNFTVDRIEGETVVVVRENGEKINLPKSFLPDAKEGDSFSLLVTDNSEKKQDLKNRLNNLFERGKNDE